MGLKCLLGHDFGPSGVVREHEEDGNEMVITEREVRRCTRCGEEQVIAESTEVRAIMNEDDLSGQTGSDRLLSPEETTGVDPEDASAENPAAQGGEMLREDAETGTDSGTAPVDADAVDDVSPDPTDEEESDTSLLERAEAGFDDEPADPDEEDAVILDESDEKPPRKHGEWPDSSDVGRPSEREEPTASPGADEAVSDGESSDGTTAVADADIDGDADADIDGDADEDDPRSLAETAAEEDAELLGSDNGTAAQETHDRSETDTVDDGSWPAREAGAADEGFAAQTATAGGPSMAFGNGLTPSTNGGHATDDYDTSYLDNTVEEREGDGTIVSATSDTDSPPPGVETEYYCPNCGTTRPFDSSLRSGDICPSCQSGYIAERAR